MSTTRAVQVLLAWQLRSEWRALLHETRARIAAVLLLLTAAASAWILGRWLGERTVPQPEAGAYPAWALLLIGTSSAALGTSACLTALRRGLGEDEAALLLTLPLTAATRFRALVAQTAVATGGQLCSAVAAVSALLVPAEPRLVLVAVASAAASVLGGVVGVLLLARHGLQRGGLAALPVVVLGGLAPLSLAAPHAKLGPLAEVAMRPETVAASLLIIAVLALGPGAERLGRFYVATWQRVYGLAGPRNAPPPLLARLLAPLVGRMRGAAGAVVFKELLHQGRSPLGRLVRLLALAAALPLFVWTRSRLASSGFADDALVVAYTSALCLYTLIDTSPSPVGAEGNRLALYLTAPVKLSEVLWGKVMAFVTPLLVQGVAISAMLSWWVQLSAGGAALVAATTATVVVGVCGFVVLASVWDEDLHASAEDPVQALLQEHAPITFPRVAIAVMGMALLAAEIRWLLSAGPAAVLLPLAGATAAALMAGWHASHRRLAALARTG